MVFGTVSLSASRPHLFETISDFLNSPQDIHRRLGADVDDEAVVSDAVGDAESLAFLGSQALDWKASYFSRGRPFRHLPDESLRCAWAGAFIAAVFCGLPWQIQDATDFHVELHLRGLTEPNEFVREAKAFLAEKIRLRGPNDPVLLDAIARGKGADELSLSTVGSGAYFVRCALSKAVDGWLDKKRCAIWRRSTSRGRQFS
jgi:hypothetical protein